MTVEIASLDQRRRSLAQRKNRQVGSGITSRDDGILTWGIVVTPRSQVPGNPNLPGAITSSHLVVAVGIAIGATSAVVGPVYGGGCINLQADRVAIVISHSSADLPRRGQGNQHEVVLVHTIHNAAIQSGPHEALSRGPAAFQCDVPGACKHAGVKRPVTGRRGVDGGGTGH